MKNLKFKSILIGVLIGAFITSSIPTIASGILKQISVYEDSIRLVVNNKDVTEDNFLYNNITYVPLRSMAEKLGAKVEWINDTRTVNVKLKQDQNEIESDKQDTKITNKSKDIEIDGKIYKYNLKKDIIEMYDIETMETKYYTSVKKTKKTNDKPTSLKNNSKHIDTNAKQNVSKEDDTNLDQNVSEEDDTNVDQNVSEEDDTDIDQKEIIEDVNETYSSIKVDATYNILRNSSVGNDWGFWIEHNSDSIYSFNLPENIKLTGEDINFHLVVYEHDDGTSDFGEGDLLIPYSEILKGKPLVYKKVITVKENGGRRYPNASADVEMIVTVTPN